MHSLNHHLKIEKGVLWLRSIRINDGDYYRPHYAFVILILGLISYSVYEIIEEDEKSNYFRIILYLIWLGPYLYRGYKWLFIYSWRSRIPIQNIKEVDRKELENGVETKLILHLKNGRRKEIIFRNAEPYMEEFMSKLNN